MALPFLEGIRSNQFSWGSLANSAIRGIIDRGYSFESPTVLGPPPSAMTRLPPGGNIWPTTTPPIVQQQMPGFGGGDWGPIIRDLIDRLLPGGGNVGGGGGLQLQEPIRDLPVVPDWIDRMLSGTLPRGAVSFITMPNGTTGCPSGYHPEKQNKPYCVRNRRMNSLNPRALSRASRRVGGFARAVKRARTLKKVCRSL